MSTDATLLADVTKQRDYFEGHGARDGTCSPHTAGLLFELFGRVVIALTPAQATEATVRELADMHSITPGEVWHIAKRMGAPA